MAEYVVFDECSRMYFDQTLDEWTKSIPSSGHQEPSDTHLLANRLMGNDKTRQFKVVTLDYARSGALNPWRGRGAV
jgi:hypothetical protein